MDCFVASLLAMVGVESIQLGVTLAITGASLIGITLGDLP
jgi:hypothetical protein